MLTFTIITVCRNDKKNLKRTADSIKQQTYKDFEYIIIDGSSTDGTKGILPSLGSDLYLSEKDTGIFDAMNKGLRLASGSFIYFLNAGDVFHDNLVLENVASQIQKSSKIDFFYGDVYYPGSMRPFSLQPEDISSFTLYRGTICHQAWFLRKAIYAELHGFDLKLKYKGDYDLLCRMVRLLKVKYKHIPICIADYMGNGFSEKTHPKSRIEFEFVRRNNMPIIETRIFDILLKLMDPIRKNKIFIKSIAKLYEMKAKTHWK